MSPSTTIFLFRYVLLTLLSAAPLMAQSSSGLAIIAGTGYGEGEAVANFFSGQGYGSFDAGVSVTSHINAGIRLPLFEVGRIGLISRAAYAYTRASFTSGMAGGLILLPDNPTPVSQMNERRLEYTTYDIGLETLVLYNPFGGLGLGIGGSVAGRWMEKWERTEHLRTPENARFVNPQGYPTRDDGRAMVTDTASPFALNPIAVGLLGSALYTLPITRQLAVVPEVDARFDLISPVVGANIQFLSISAGISLQYLLSEGEPPATEIYLGDIPAPPAPVPSTVPSPDPVAETPPLAASIDLFTLEGETRVQSMRLVTTQSLRKQEIALEPLVRFEPGSTTLPARYLALDDLGAASLSVDSLARLEPLHIESHLLNILGARLQAASGEKLRLVVSRRAGESAAFASARAEAVRSYMTDIWKIIPSRLSIETKAGREDGGVRLIGSKTILAPLRAEWIEQTTVASPLQIDPRISGGTGPRSWTLTLHRGGELVARHSSEDAGALDLDLAFGMPVAGVAPAPLTAELVVRDGNGATVTARDTMALVVE